MRTKAVCPLGSRGSTAAWAFVFAAAIASLPATAQDVGGQRLRLTPTERHAAQVLRAEHVAAKLGLTDKATGQLVIAYRDALQSFADVRGISWRHGRANWDSRSNRARATYAQMVAKERAKLRKALLDSLTEAQAATASERLGAFNRQWDLMVHVVAGFDLGDKQSEALEAVNTYVVECAKLAESPEARREGRAALIDRVDALKEALDESLARLLSEEQTEVWRQATAPPRRPSGKGSKRKRDTDEDGGRVGSDLSREDSN